MAAVIRHILNLFEYRSMSGRSIVRQMSVGSQCGPRGTQYIRDRKHTVSSKLELLASLFNFVHRLPTAMRPNKVFVGFKRTVRNILKMGCMNTKRLE